MAIPYYLVTPGQTREPPNSEHCHLCRTLVETGYQQQHVLCRMGSGKLISHARKKRSAVSALALPPMIFQ